MRETFLLIFLGWFVFISLVTAIVTVADKVKAQKGSFRIPEKALFLLALLGGSVAEYAVMRLIRHKTLHKRFMLGLPAIITLQLILIAIVLIRLPL